MTLMTSESRSRPRARRTTEFVVAGRVVRPHGMRGDLLIEPVSQLMHSLGPGSDVFLGPGRVPASVESCRLHAKRWLMRLEGTQDVTAAESWRGAEVALRFEPETQLQPGEYFYWQILGLQVKTEVGRELGEIVEILETGANDVYVVRDGSGNELLLPAIRSVVLDVDLDAGWMKVFLLPGLEETSRRPSPGGA